MSYDGISVFSIELSYILILILTPLFSIELSYIPIIILT